MFRSFRKTTSGPIVVLGAMMLGSNDNKAEELANTMQVYFDAGAKKVLLSMASAADIPTVPSELFAKFQMAFYQSPEEAFFLRPWG